MDRFKSLFNNQEQDPFKTFAETNKNNVGPDTSLGVPETFKNAYQGTQDLRQKAIEKIAEQTDLGKDIPGVGANEDYRNVAKTGLDMVMPDVTDLIPAGKVGHTAHAMFPMLGMMAKKEGKLLQFPKIEKTAEEMVQGFRKAESADLKLGSNLLNQPVLKTAEEKTVQALPNAFGKVITPDMGKQISNADLMSELEKSKVWKEHRANRDMFKNDNANYMRLKELMIQAAKKKLSQE